MEEERKLALLSQGIPQRIYQEQKKVFYTGEASPWLHDLMVDNPSDFRDGVRIKASYRKRVSRCKDKTMLCVVDGQGVFITLTFTDEVLAKTSEATRRRYVARWLKKHCAVYVGNIDFSPEKHREHYHAVGYPLDGRIEPGSWKYGFCKVKRVRNQDKDATRTAKYINKFVNHARKVDGQFAKPPRLIYSRLAW